MKFPGKTTLVGLTLMVLSGCQTIPPVSTDPKAQGEFTFVFDDGYETDYSVSRGIFEDRGIRCGIAVTTGWTGTFAHTTVDELRKLQDEGFEIMSHSITHPYMPRVSDAESERQLAESKATLTSWGLKVNSFVFPYNQYSQRDLDLAAKYYRFARAGQRQVNYSVDKPWSLFSYPMSSGLKYCEDKVDEAASHNGWIFLYHHEIEAGLKFDNLKGRFTPGEDLVFTQSHVEGKMVAHSLGFFGSNFIYNPMSDGTPVQGETIVGKASGATCTVRNVVYNDRATLEQLLDYVKTRWPAMKVVTPTAGFEAMKKLP